MLQVRLPGLRPHRDSVLGTLSGLQDEPRIRASPQTNLCVVEAQIGRLEEPFASADGDTWLDIHEASTNGHLHQREPFGRPPVREPIVNLNAVPEQHRPISEAAAQSVVLAVLAPSPNEDDGEHSHYHRKEHVGTHEERMPQAGLPPG